MVRNVEKGSTSRKPSLSSLAYVSHEAGDSLTQAGDLLELTSRPASAHTAHTAASLEDVTQRCLCWW